MQVLRQASMLRLHSLRGNHGARCLHGLCPGDANMRFMLCPPRLINRAGLANNSSNVRMSSRSNLAVTRIQTMQSKTIGLACGSVRICSHGSVPRTRLKLSVPRIDHDHHGKADEAVLYPPARWEPRSGTAWVVRDRSSSRDTQLPEFSCSLPCLLCLLKCSSRSSR